MNKMKKLSVVLTIAGSDSSGGAGIQADLKTMSAFGVYGMSVITAVTAQNTCGVTGVQSVTGEMIRLQLEAVLKDIKPDAVKIGMLSTAEAVPVVWLICWRCRWAWSALAPFPLAAFQRHGWHWRCSIRVNFAVCRRGQILHLTGVRSRCRALT